MPLIFDCNRLFPAFGVTPRVAQMDHAFILIEYIAAAYTVATHKLSPKKLGNQYWPVQVGRTCARVLLFVPHSVLIDVIMLLRVDPCANQVF